MQKTYFEATVKESWEQLLENYHLFLMAQIPERVDKLRWLGKPTTPIDVWRFLEARHAGLMYHGVTVDKVAAYLHRHELTYQGPRQKPPKSKYEQLSLF